MANLSPIILLLLVLFQNPPPISAYIFPLYHQNHPLITKHLGLDENQAPATNGNLSNIEGVYGIFFDVGLKPTSRVLLVFDTGSALTWIQPGNCSSCMPWENTYTSSSTLTPLPCNDGFDEPRLCVADHIPRARCIQEHCWYKTQYGDGSTAVGVIAYETIGLEFGTYPSFRILLGLGYENWCVNNSTICFEGIAGFGGRDYMTIPSQLKVKRWAFCLPIQESDPGFITLDDLLQFKGKFNTAPLDFDADFSLAYLSNVIVHGQNILQPTDKTRVLLDSGTFLTYLESQLFDRLIASVKYIIALDYAVAPSLAPDPWPLCYNSALAVDVSIQIGQVIIDISDPDHTWYKLQRAEPTFCFTFRRAAIYQPSVIGTYHLRGYMIAYDLSLDQPMLQVSISRLDRDNCASA